MDAQYVDGLAERIASRKLSGVAVLILELAKPVSFIGSQLLWMLDPLMSPLLGDLRPYARLLEDRHMIDRLLAALERERQGLGDRASRHEHEGLGR